MQLNNISIPVKNITSAYLMRTANAKLDGLPGTTLANITHTIHIKEHREIISEVQSIWETGCTNYTPP